MNWYFWQKSSNHNHIGIAGKDQWMPQTKLTYILLIWFGLTLENAANRSLILPSSRCTVNSHIADSVESSGHQVDSDEMSIDFLLPFNEHDWALKNMMNVCLFIPVICPHLYSHSCGHTLLAYISNNAARVA